MIGRYCTRLWWYARLECEADFAKPMQGVMPRRTVLPVAPAKCDRGDSPLLMPCSGHGQCVEALAAVASAATAACSCDSGWADSGCSVPAPEISNGAVLNTSVAVGDWLYYQLEVRRPLS